jgi:hypothetical protein
VDDWQRKFGLHWNFVSLGMRIVKGGVKRLACDYRWPRIGIDMQWADIASPRD